MCPPAPNFCVEGVHTVTYSMTVFGDKVGRESLSLNKFVSVRTLI